MPRFGKVTAVVEKPIGTTLAVPALAGDTQIIVDDVSNGLAWPSGGIRIGDEITSELKIYTVDDAPDETIDVLDDDDAEDVSEGTLTLMTGLGLDETATLVNGYDQDTPVIFYPTVIEKIATVQLPDQEEELVLRVPHELHNKLPLNIRDNSTTETVELEFSDGEWVIADIVSQEPSVDGSYIDQATLPASQGPNSPSSVADGTSFFTEAWSNPTNAEASDNAWASAVGTAVSGTPVPGTTGYRLAGVGVDDASVGTIPWYHPGSVTEAGNWVAATADTIANAPGTSHYLEATNFGFSVPAGATITGVTVQIVRRRQIVASVADNIVKLVKGGTVQGADKASGATWPGPIQPGTDTATYGGSSDLWGLTLAPSDVNASNFGVVLSVSIPDLNVIAQVDYIRIKVNYTIPPAVDRSNTHFLVASGFGFTIPDDATVTGITAEIERHASADSGDNYAIDNQIRLTKGTSASDSKADFAQHWPTSDVYSTYGNDLWGTSWSPDEINDPAFGILISADVANGVTAYVDHVRLTVHYVVAGDKSTLA